ncbi:chemotaxis protein [Succinivibrio sp.]|uniref:chemotaxis protein n=1 Tax=Succinivibrio sp. TaxID=2053619 RepID=UPI0025E05B55|nr:chemotaxis protein [uncultured Succinivibrio sp.]
MAGLIENIERRTGMVGQNRMEMLLFRLPNRKQLYGMNVFKILEILPCPHLTIMPKLHKSVIGVLNHRGTTSSVIDLSLAMEGPKTDDYRKYLLVMSEYNNSVQGFIVSKVERIVDYSWDKIMIPPSGLGNKAYLTAVTEYQNELVEIVDVEKIFSEISPYEEIVDNNTEEFKAHIRSMLKHPEAKIIVADDSKVAIKQTGDTVRTLGIEVIEANNGLDALNIIKDYSAKGKLDEIELLISDVEMPQLDGYSLSAALRKDPLLKDIYVILHTSLSGVFNESMLHRSGANSCVAKFDTEKLAKTVVKAIEELHGGLKPSESVTKLVN